MSMPTARILLVLIFVRAKLDTVEMERHAQVDNRNVVMTHEVPDNVVDTSEPSNKILQPIVPSLRAPTK